MQGTSVCRKWNDVLLSPACNDLWHDTPYIDLLPVRTQWTERREKFSRLAHWLSARAATLGVLRISCRELLRRTDGDDGEGGMTDLLYFAEKLLPYLLGLLELRGLRLKFHCYLDADILGGVLMQQPWLSCLGKHLINLTLLLTRHRPSQIELDCLAGLSSLTSLHVSVGYPETVWKTKGQLSLLTSLKTIQLLERGDIKGPLTASVATLPHLTQLDVGMMKRFEVHSMQFTALQLFTSDGTAKAPLTVDLAYLRHPQQPLAQFFGSLTDIRIWYHTLDSPSLPLQAVPMLKAFMLHSCDIRPEDWLACSLQGATQLQCLRLSLCKLTEAPDNVSALASLTCLVMRTNSLQDLSASLTNLTKLQTLILNNCWFESIPTVLEQMTHLQVIDICNSRAALQVTRPLSFLAAFSKLKSVCMNSNDWSALSMFHLGTGQAALDRAFKHRPRRDRPVLNWQA